MYGGGFSRLTEARPGTPESDKRDETDRNPIRKRASFNSSNSETGKEVGHLSARFRLVLWEEGGTLGLEVTGLAGR